jgi:hypothetical protein
MNAIFGSRGKQSDNNSLQQSFSILNTMKNVPWKNAISPSDTSHGNDPIIIGYDTSKKPVYWTYDPTGTSTPSAPHLLVYGESGSGRELLIESIIRQITDFDDASLYIIDPTKTVDEINTILESIVKTIMQRFQVLEEQSYNSYHNLIGTPYEMHKIFLIINHLDDVLGTTDSESDISTICRLGRAVGVFVVCSAQPDAKKRIPDSSEILANIGARVTLGYCKTNPYDNTPNKDSNLIPRGTLTGIISLYGSWSKAFRLTAHDTL